MTWEGNVAAQVRSEFASAQRMSRGIIERASDEREVDRLKAPIEIVIRARRRIIKSRFEETGDEP